MEEVSQDRPVVQPPGETQQCPVCDATVPVLRGYTTWCEHCGWNVKPYDPRPPHNVFEAKYAELGKKYSLQLMERMRDEKNLRPALTPGLIVAFAVASLVHLLTLSIALFGVWLLFAGYCVLFILGLFCLVVAWALRPRIPKERKDGIAARSEFPALYRLADQVAEAISAPPVDVIRLDGRYNASFWLVGWRRKRVVALGLPLFSILTAQERVALLGHELGHCVNGDITRTFVVRTAIDTLVSWHGLFHPGSIWRGAGRYQGGIGGIAPGLATIPANLFMLGIAQIAKFWIFSLVNLTWSDTQRAEYLADALGAKAAGTAATVGALETFYLRDVVNMTIDMVTLNPNSNGEDLFAELRRCTSQVPEREWERIRRSQGLANSRLDATHPPTAYRLEMLRAHQVSQPAVVLSEADSREIERELSKVSPDIQKTIVGNRLLVIG
jgi:heat shock protein HtpX